jgi:nucleoside-diphosphate-sugar epimerase
VAVESFFSTPRSILPALACDGDLTCIDGSISEPSVLERAFDAAPVDAVVHLAAQASAHPSAASLAYTLTTNVTGAHAVFDIAARRNVRHLIAASSMRLYAQPLPAVVSESSALAAPDPVHVSQLLQETLLAALPAEHPEWNGRATGLRIGTVYGVGPLMKEDLRFLAVPQRFCQQASRGEGLQVDTAGVLAVVHLDDVVDALAHCLHLDVLPPLANLAAEVLPISAIAEMVRSRAEDRGVSIRIETPPSIAASSAHPPEVTIASALAATGFQPNRRMDERLGEVLDHYMNAAGRR